MQTMKCYTKGCRRRIQLGSKYNNYNLWCDACHKAADPTAHFTPSQKREYLQRQFAQRIFRDGRAGKLQSL